MNPKMDPLSSPALIEHVLALAAGIGPRPPGSIEETAARMYVRDRLQTGGYQDIMEIPFPAWESMDYNLAAPLGLGLTGSLLKAGGRLGQLIGGLASLFGAYELWNAARMGKSRLEPVFPARPSADLVVRIPPAGQRRERVVLIASTDSGKAREYFRDERKRWLPAAFTLGIGLLAMNGLAGIRRAFEGGQKGAGLQTAAMLGLGALLVGVLRDEGGAGIPGANENASGTACLLGLAQHLREDPLRHTEVWLAFTGAEQSGGLGVHRLLDVYGAPLRDSWFIELKMVGAAEIAYVIEHSSFSYLSGYRPDPDSLELARETAADHPELGVGGRMMTIADEVGSLRSRGFRGLAVVGVGDDGWLPHWNRPEDDLEHLDPEGLERAARFTLAMIHKLDEEAGRRGD